MLTGMPTFTAAASDSYTFISTHTRARLEMVKSAIVLSDRSCMPGLMLRSTTKPLTGALTVYTGRPAAALPLVAPYTFSTCSAPRKAERAFSSWARAATRSFCEAKLDL